MSAAEHAGQSSTQPTHTRKDTRSAEPLPDADSVLDRRDSADSPSPFDAGTSLKPSERIAAFPHSVDLGEHIVGSSHPLDVVTPRITARSPLPAVAIVSISPASALVSRSEQDPLDRLISERRRAQAFSPVEVSHSVSPTMPIPVRFWPAFPGDHEADLRILLRWSDDVMDLRTVRVYAHARRLEDAPARPLGESGVQGAYQEPNIPTADLQHVAQVHMTALSNAMGRAKTQAGGLASAQQTGRRTAETNARDYNRQPPKAPWWASLAELAITMAVGGVAGLVGRYAANALGSKLAAGVATVKGGLDPARLKQYSEGLVADTVKEGLKNAAKSPLVKLAIGTKDRESARIEEGARSSNGVINFFAMQEAALNKLITANQTFVDGEHERLQHTLRTDPEVAVASMEALEVGMHQASETAAEQRQQIESERQWTSIVARSSNGTDTVRVNGEERDVTTLGRATRATRGVLRIRATVRPGPETDEVQAVKSASMDGISQELADRMHRQDLSAAPVAVMIIAESEIGTSIITRDEVGRVRQRVGDAGNEASQHRRAQALCDRVLAKTLVAWGIERIVTDDEPT